MIPVPLSVTRYAQPANISRLVVVDVRGFDRAGVSALFAAIGTNQASLLDGPPGFLSRPIYDANTFEVLRAPSLGSFTSGPWVRLLPGFDGRAGSFGVRKPPRTTAGDLTVSVLRSLFLVLGSAADRTFATLFDEVQNRRQATTHGTMTEHHGTCTPLVSPRRSLRSGAFSMVAEGEA